jgi:peptidoglycan-associated lipoprotein
MIKPTLYAKWISLVFAAFVLAACSGNDTKEAEAEAEAAAAEEQAAQEAAAQEAEQQAQVKAQQGREAAAANVGTVFYFEFDSSSLTEDARAQVDAHIRALLGNNDSVRLEGHTDERGTREYNLALGERRANAVRDYMVANGLPSYRVETISYGEENPVAYGSGETNWQQNRRVELK